MPLLVQLARCTSTLSLLAFCSLASPVQSQDKLILDDAFERSEASPELEDVGNGWTTNSKSRAKGVKQVDLRDGAIYITRAEVADHGVSVVHDLDFKDAKIQLRFKLDPKDSLGINIADMNEKSVHAGHICLALVSCKKLEIADLKTGRMELAARTRRIEGKQTEADKAKLKEKAKTFPLKLSPNEWHTLEVTIAGDTMSVSIDDAHAGKFSSEGIAHATKNRLRLAVAKSAWVDDVKVWRQKPQ